MKVFGHYVARPVAMLASFDAALFLGFLYLLSLGKHCSGCYVGSFLDLKLYESLILTGIFLVVSISVGVYNRDALQDFRVFLKRFLLAWQMILLSAVGLLGVSKAAAGSPFGWYLGILTVAVALFMVIQFGVRALLMWRRDAQVLKKRVIVVGDGASSKEVITFLNGFGRMHLTLVGTASAGKRGAAAALVGNLALKLRETTTPLTEMAAATRADMIVVAVEDKRGLPVADLLDCKLKGVDVVDALTFWEREAGEIDVARVGAGWLTFAEGFMLDQRSRFIKRAVDFIVSLAFLIAVMPIVVLTALAIKLESPGPVIYRQERVGLNGKVFSVWKFRSMRTDAEKDGVPRFASTTDARVTRIGKFIRKVRIDEIPQIVNVLRGDMSFVGPRPERPYFTEQLRKEIPHYDLRHKVKPGITGWAQINYPYGDTIEDAKRKHAFDLYYLKNNDIVLDFAILAQTVRVVLFAHGSR